MPSRRVLINLALFGISVAVALSQTSVQDYLFSRSPRERLMNHFKEFERKVARDPEIHRALENVSREEDRTAKLKELSRLGESRLDGVTLLERARILSALYSKLSDRACADIERGSPPTENDTAELEQALVRLEYDGVSKWMDCLHKSMLAEVRQDPKPVVTRPQLVAAYGALEQKVGRPAAMRMDANLDYRASNEDLAWAARTVYGVAPTLPPQHGVVLLRFMTHNYQESDSIPPPRTPEAP
jgi:hypothetical protein